MRKTFFQKSHLFFEVYLGSCLRNPCFFENKKRTAAKLRAVSRQQRVQISHMCQKTEESDYHQTPTSKYSNNIKKTFRVFIFGEFSKSQGRCQTNNYDITEPTIVLNNIKLYLFSRWALWSSRSQTFGALAGKTCLCRPAYIIQAIFNYF